MFHQRSQVSLLALSAGLGVLLGGPATAQTLPTDGRVTAGTATIGAAGPNGLLVKQTSPRAIIDWSSFSIGQGSSVTFAQPGTTAAALNRVTGSTGSTIAGSLAATGQILLINPNGIEITPSGAVRAAGLTASTLNMSNEDFLAGKDVFTGSGASAAVSNAGKITIMGGGDAVLIGGSVSNTGTIRARGGRVGLAAGEEVAVDVEGDGFLTVSVPSKGGSADALIRSAGKIRAAGGMVEARAATSADLAREAINIDGTIEARSVSRGQGGAVSFGSVTLDGGAGGTVRVSGRLSTAGAKGGAITITGRAVALESATLDASGRDGGGTIRVGGNKQGGGGLATASTTMVGASTVLKADATAKGDGGSVVVWADDTTQFAGRISARGGAHGGNGGDAEVSGKAHLDLSGASGAIADLTALHGTAGTLLLDPGTVYILPAAGLTGNVALNGPDTFTDSFISQQLALGNLIIDTNNATGANGSAGNIELRSSDVDSQLQNNAAATIAWSAPTTLTLNAANSLVFDPRTSITHTGASAGNLVLHADTDGSGGGTILFNGSGQQVSLNGGSATLYYDPAATPSPSWATSISASDLTAYKLLYDATGLQAMAGDLSGDFALAKDIDASTVSNFSPIGSNANPFAGALDGLSHEISGLKVAVPNGADVGLFGVIGSSGSVSHLQLAGANVSGFISVGALAGRNKGTINDVSVSGSVQGTNTVGGIVGSNEGSIDRAEAGVQVTGVAGLLNGPASVVIGGLAGWNFGSITTSFATGTASGHGYVGGFVGGNSGSISQAYALGDVTATVDKAGGFVGISYYPDTSSISDAYSSGKVTSPGLKGGFVGRYQGGSFTNVYWDVGSSGLALASGTPMQASAGTITPLTSPAAKNLASYPGFNPAVWQNGSGGARPVFDSGLTFHAAEPFVAPTGVIVKIAATNAARPYGATDALSYVVTDANGNVIDPSQYATYFDTFSAPALATTTAPSANAGTQGTIYIAQNGFGVIKPKAGYQLVFINGDETVTRRPITVTADDKTKIYGNVDPALTYKLSEQLLAGNNLTGSLHRQVGEDAGSYAIGRSTLSAGGNYDIHFIDGTFVIAPRAITIAADDKTKVAGAANPLLTYALTSGSLVSGDALTGSLVSAGLATDTVGTYSIDQGTLTAGSNYAISFTPGVFSITAAAPATPSLTSVFIEQFFRTPTQLNASRVAGPAVSGEGVAGIFAPGAASITTAQIITSAIPGGGMGDGQAGIADIVTSSIGDDAGGGPAAAGGDQPCFVQLDGDRSGTLNCSVARR